MAELLVIGDSILWGQGLAEEEKCTALLVDAWGQSIGAKVNVTRFAHSGADVWDDGMSGVHAAIEPFPQPFSKSFTLGEGAIRMTRPCPDAAQDRDALGEIPDEEPYALRQILDAGDALAGKKVDLVLVDAGINDTEVYNLVLPGKDRTSVVARGRSVKSRVAFMLQKITEKFPDAKIVVTGYYPVVSEQSHVGELLQFGRAVVDAAIREGARIIHGMAHPIESAQRLMVLDAFLILDPFGFLLRDISDRCRAWTHAVHRSLREAVSELDPQGTKAAFVDPDFGPEHAVFAPQSLLWKFRGGEAIDPKRQERRRYCDSKGITGFDRFIIERASMGHPNPAGAARYGDKIVAAAKALGVFQ